MQVVLEIYKHIYNGRILMAAPTGRASRRMAESTGFTEAQTLHSALGLVADDDGDYMGSHEPLDCDFVIVDECSMIDMKLAYELFSRIERGTKVLLVGDADQLPSVGAGNVFRELIGCGLIPVTVLDMVFRQHSVSRIALNAHSIRESNVGLLYGDDFEFINCDTDEKAAEIICERYMREVNASGVNSVQILSPFRRNGGACVKVLNETIRELVNPKSPKVRELKVGTRIFRENDRILQMKNKNGVSNGDIGVITNVFNGNDSDSSVTIEFSDDRAVEYGTDDMDIIEHSYAMTIHKSQGSEYDTVIIPVLKSFYIMLKRNLIYTAVTRAKKKVIIVGQKQALAMAVKTNDTDKRNTMLAARIQGFHRKLLEKEFGRNGA